MFVILAGLVALVRQFPRQNRVSLVQVIRQRERFAQDKKRQIFTKRRRAEARRQPFDPVTAKLVDDAERGYNNTIDMMRGEQQRIIEEGRHRGDGGGRIPMPSE